MILTPKQPKYLHQIKFINIKILQMQIPLDQSRMTEQAKFTYSPLGKAFDKQI